MTAAPKCAGEWARYEHFKFLVIGYNIYLNKSHGRCCLKVFPYLCLLIQFLAKLSSSSSSNIAIRPTYLPLHKATSMKSNSSCTLRLCLDEAKVCPDGGLLFILIIIRLRRKVAVVCLCYVGLKKSIVSAIGYRLVCVYLILYLTH